MDEFSVYGVFGVNGPPQKLLRYDTLCHIISLSILAVLIHAMSHKKFEVCFVLEDA